MTYWILKKLELTFLLRERTFYNEHKAIYFYWIVN